MSSSAALSMSPSLPGARAKQCTRCGEGASRCSSSIVRAVSWAPTPVRCGRRRSAVLTPRSTTCTSPWPSMPYSTADSAGATAEARTATYAGSYCGGSSAAPGSPGSPLSPLSPLWAAAASIPSIWRSECRSAALSPRGRGVGLHGGLSVGPRVTGGGGGLRRLCSRRSVLGPAGGGGGAAGLGPPSQWGTQAQPLVFVRAAAARAAAAAAASLRPRKLASMAWSAWAWCVVARAGARTSVR